MSVYEERKNVRERRAYKIFLVLNNPRNVLISFLCKFERSQVCHKLRFFLIKNDAYKLKKAIPHVISALFHFGYQQEFKNKKATLWWAGQG